jgi:putative ABC transport system permease protein
MRLLSHVGIAWQGVGRRPLRSLLTGLSLLVGVLTIVLIQGGGAAVRAAIVLDAVLQGAPATTVQVALSPAADQESTARIWVSLLTAATSDVAGAVATVIQPTDVTIWAGGRPAPDLTVSLVDPAVRRIRPFPVLSGRWFSDDHTIAPQLIVNRAAWETLPWTDGPAQVATGSAQERLTARIVGVVYDGSRRPAAYLSLTEPGPWRDSGYDRGSVSLIVHSPHLSENALRRRVLMVATVSGRTQEIGDIGRLDRLDEYIDQLNATRRIFLGVATLSVLVGSMGILNVGLATLRERADELSLRRSFGATRAHTVQIMIIESQLIATGAALVAIAAAALGLPLVLDRIGPQYHLVPTALPIDAVGTGLCTSALAALLGALAPTIRASRTPISSIMRA